MTVRVSLGGGILLWPQKFICICLVRPDLILLQYKLHTFFLFCLTNARWNWDIETMPIKNFMWSNLNSNIRCPVRVDGPDSISSSAIFFQEVLLSASTGRAQLCVHSLRGSRLYARPSLIPTITMSRVHTQTKTDNRRKQRSTKARKEGKLKG